MSTIKSLPSENTFNSMMEGKSTSLGFYQENYDQQKQYGFQKQDGQQHSVKKAAQDIVQKKLTQLTGNNKKPKKPVEELAVPVLLNLPTQIQHIHSGAKVAFLSSEYGAEKKNSEVNQSINILFEVAVGQIVGEDPTPLLNINANTGTVSMTPSITPSFKTKAMEQKAARFLSDNPISTKQTQWMSTPLAQKTELVDMVVLRSPLRDGQSNLGDETHSEAEPVIQTQYAFEGQNASANHEGRPTPNERPKLQHFPDMKSFNIEKSEVIQPDEIDITQNILTQIHSEMSERPQATLYQSSISQASTYQGSTATPQAQSVTSQAVELMAAASEIESSKVVPSRTLSYTFSQWQNTPTVSFVLANANQDQVMASTRSHEVQQALQDNQHLWTGEQKMVIRREEQEGQRRQQQQQQDEES